MKATIGRIVHYRLSDTDASVISQARSNSGVIANSAGAGEYYPAVVVRNFGGDHVNLQVLLDGPDSYWATSRGNGDGHGQWIWPPREATPEATTYTADGGYTGTHAAESNSVAEAYTEVRADNDAGEAHPLTAHVGE